MTTVKLAGSPWGAAVSSRGVVLVTRFDTDSIAVVDLGSARVTRGIAAGPAPEDVCFTADGSAAFVADFGGDAVAVVDPGAGVQRASYPVPGRPFHVALGDSDTRVFAPLDDSRVAVLDARTGAVLATVPTGTTPFSIAANPAGTRVYVGDAYDGTVTEINTVTDSITRSMLMGGVPQVVWGVAVSPDGRTLYVGLEAGWIGVVSLATWRQTDSMRVSSPYALALTPDGTQLWVAQPGVDSVTVLDGATGRAIEAFHTAGPAHRVAFSPDGSAAVVTDWSGAVMIVR